MGDSRRWRPGIAHAAQSDRARRCGFGYRDSVFKADLDNWAITAVEFRLPRQRELRLDYAGVREELQAMGVEAPRAVHVAEAISRIRTRKLPNPAILGNAGSFFKNRWFRPASPRPWRAHPCCRYSATSRCAQAAPPG